MSLPNSKPDVTRLKILSEEYRQIVQLMRDTSMIEISAEVDALGAERSLLHDEIIAEFARLGYPVTNRKEARERAFNLVSWLHDVGLEGEKDSFAAASSSGAETTKLFTMKIITNKIQGLHCSAIIESLHRYDFVTCPCGTVAVDGGREYLRRLGKTTDFREMSQVEEDGTPLQTSDE